MRPDPDVETIDLLGQLEGLAAILRTLGSDAEGRRVRPSSLVLLGSVTSGIANTLMDRLTAGELGDPAAPALTEALVDRRLLRLCAEYRRVHAEYRRVSEPGADLPPRSPEAAANEAIWRPLQAEALELWNEITLIPARTQQGLQAKAGVMQTMTFEAAPEGDPDDAMAWSLLQDVLRGTP